MAEQNFVRIPKSLLDALFCLSKEFEAMSCMLPEDVKDIACKLGSKLQEIENFSNDRQSTVDG